MLEYVQVLRQVAPLLRCLEAPVQQFADNVRKKKRLSTPGLEEISRMDHDFAVELYDIVLAWTNPIKSSLCIQHAVMDATQAQLHSRFFLSSVKTDQGCRSSNWLH